MNKSQYLDYQVSLVLAQYGKSAVFAAMARHLGLSEKELEAQLNNPPGKTRSASRGKRPSADDAIETTIAEHPDKAEQLRRIRNQFDSRLFLPSLRDVKRFCDQSGYSFGHPKSRQQFLPKLLMHLADLDYRELESLAGNSSGRDRSSLSMISDEILRRDNQ